jgi:hypothetical protein
MVRVGVPRRPMVAGRRAQRIIFWARAWRRKLAQELGERGLPWCPAARSVDTAAHDGPFLPARFAVVSGGGRCDLPRNANLTENHEKRPLRI